jgi:wyosine [tRNA(Phe)-imidazoG37] synthetase (radical SAM superfamily)
MAEASGQDPRPVASRVYGPVSSRRLGRSLGVDLVPYKACPYDCVYCQLGPTTRLTATRATFFPVRDLVHEILAKAETFKPDTITLAGSGEPTLYRALGALIGGIKAATKVPVALLTNGALFGDPEVRREAALCDLVIPSLDAGEESFFQWVNRPVEGLTLEKITEGLVLFRDAYRGPIWLEVMVLQGLTEQHRHLRAIAERAKPMRPDKIQLNTPIRPSASDFVFPVGLARLEEFCSFFDPKAEVIAQTSKGGTCAPVCPEAAAPILEMLWRRPCTLEDICAGLGTSAPGALKVLE